MQCKVCGGTISDTAKFCNLCGSKVEVIKQPEPEPVNEAPQFCGNCGAQMKPGAAFCMNCGTRVQATPSPVSEPTPAAPQEPAPVTPMKPLIQVDNGPESAPEPPEVLPAKPVKAKKAFKPSPKLFIAVAAVLLVVVIAAAAVLLLGGKSPAKLIEQGLVNTLSDYSDTINNSTIGGALSHGSVTVSSDLSKWDMSGMPPMAFDVAYFNNLSKSQAAVTVKAASGGAEVFSAGVYANDKELILELPALFKDVYGIDLSDAEDNLEKSVFAPKSGSDYALSQAVYDEILSTLKQANGDSKQLAKDTKALAIEYATALIEAGCKYGNAEKGSATLEIGSSTLKTTAITLHLTPEAICDVLEDMLGKADSDKQLKETFAQIFDLVINTSPELARQYKNADDAWDDIMDSAVKSLKSMRKSAEKASADNELTLTFHLSKKNTIAGIIGEISSGKNTAGAVLLLGESVAATEEISFRAYMGSNDVVSAVYSVRENDKSGYSADLAVKTNGRDMGSVKLEWDKKNETFTIDAMGFALSGSISEKSNVLTVEVNSITAYGQKLQAPVTVAFDAKASVPSFPKYKDVLTLKESDIETIIDAVEEVYSVLRYLV